MPAGRPEIEIDVAEVERLAGLGLTEEQIANSVGVSYRTLLERKKKYAHFQQAIKNGKASAISAVANALFDSATVDKNVSAQIFYLKNRGRESWRDKWAEDEAQSERVININMMGAEPSDDG